MKSIKKPETMAIESTSSLHGNDDIYHTDDKIVVIAFDIQKSHSKYIDYCYSSADEKLDIFVAAIKKLYKKIDEAHPNVKKIIFSWSELAIFEISANALNKNFAKRLKDTFKELTAENNKLIIVSGAMLIKSNNAVLPPEKRKEISASYTQYSTLFKKRISEIGDIEIHKFAQQVNNTPPTALITKVKNNSYLFSHGKKTKHGKITPYNEFIRDKKLTNPVFQLGKGEKYSSAITKTDSLTIATEICREHLFNIAQLAAQEENLSSTMIDIHFVLSATIDVEADMMLKNAKMVIHIDSITGVTTFSPSRKIDETILVYEFNLAHYNPTLSPIQPIYPLQFKIDEFLAALNVPMLPADIKNFSRYVTTALLTDTQIDRLQTKLCSLIKKYFNNNEIKQVLTEIASILYGHCEEIKYNNLMPLKSNIEDALGLPIQTQNREDMPSNKSRLKS